MGLRGPAPKPTALRIVEGNRSHRPLPVGEPQYAAAIPKCPRDLSPAARKIWRDLVREMSAVNLLRRVDAHALRQLCENQALLDQLHAGLSAHAESMASESWVKGNPLSGGPMVALLSTIAGRRIMSSIRELEAQLVTQRREFGLTPASRTRVSTITAGPAADHDPWSQL
jgi:P27 family predicted phage terminase small subunit